MDREDSVDAADNTFMNLVQNPSVDDIDAEIDMDDDIKLHDHLTFNSQEEFDDNQNKENQKNDCSLQILSEMVS
jgi:hypothetical protein